MSETQTFNLPDVGEGLTEADIVAWYVKIGDKVAVNDALVDVETAKSVVELPSPFAGVVLSLDADVGQTVPVGAPLITIGSSPAVDAVTMTPGHEAPNETTVSLQAVGDAAIDRAMPDPSRSLQADTGKAPSQERHFEIQPADLGTDEGSAVIGVDDAPAVLVGTGPKEAVKRRVHIRRPAEDQLTTRQTLAARALSARPQAAHTTRAGGESERIPIKGVRKAIAEAMVRSAFTAPHATMWTTVDVTGTTDLVARLKRDRDWADLRINSTLIAAKVLALTVQRYPAINASWDESAQEIVMHGALNLGVAAATPRGLMVPNIKDAGSMGLRELSEAYSEIINRARSGKLTPAEMSDGTLTMTNVGTFGVDGATPILNPPEAAIVALGAIKPAPWVVDGALRVRDVMTLAISIDHRLVDGELGAKVLRQIADVLHDPSLALV